MEGKGTALRLRRVRGQATMASPEERSWKELRCGEFGGHCIECKNTLYYWQKKRRERVGKLNGTNPTLASGNT